MLYTGAVDPVAFPDPVYGRVWGRMKGKQCDGLGMTKEGARRSIRLDKAYLWQLCLTGHDCPPESPVSWETIAVPEHVCLPLHTPV